MTGTEETTNCVIGERETTQRKSDRECAAKLSSTPRKALKSEVAVNLRAPSVREALSDWQYVRETVGEKVIHTVPRCPCSHRLFLPSRAYGVWSPFFFLVQLCEKKKKSYPLASTLLNSFPCSRTQGISLTFFPFCLQLFHVRSYITTHWSMSKAQSKQSSDTAWNNLCVYVLNINLTKSRYRNGMMVCPTANTKCFAHTEPFETC